MESHSRPPCDCERSHNPSPTGIPARERYIPEENNHGSTMNYVIIAQIVFIHKGLSAALKVVQDKTKAFMVDFPDTDGDDWLVFGGEGAA